VATLQRDKSTSNLALIQQAIAENTLERLQTITNKEEVIMQVNQLTDALVDIATNKIADDQAKSTIALIDYIHFKTF
jgi:hypothetical protein